MKITKISAQVKNPDRVNIFIDDEYSFSLTLSQLLECKVSQNQEVSETDVKKLKKLSADGLMRSRAFSWVISRPHSSQELRDYLRKKGADNSLVKSICSEFEAKGYQNDGQFAIWWIENRVARQKSNLSIKMELKQKGVSGEIIEGLLNNQADSKGRIKSLIITKRLLIKYPDEIKLKKYLLSKGFNYSDIAVVLAELNEEADDLTF